MRLNSDAAMPLLQMSSWDEPSLLLLLLRVAACWEFHRCQKELGGGGRVEGVGVDWPPLSYIPPFLLLLNFILPTAAVATELLLIH